MYFSYLNVQDAMTIVYVQKDDCSLSLSLSTVGLS